MTNAEIIKANDILKKLDFFGGQRAGRELWFEKPTDIQNEDVENFSKDVAFLKDFINRQKAEIEKYKNIKATMDEFWDILLKIKFAKRKEKPTLEELAEALEKIKAEAIKEFAERLKIKLFKRALEKSNPNTYPNDLDSVEVGDTIDNLVKEMTE